MRFDNRARLACALAACALLVGGPVPGAFADETGAGSGETTGIASSSGAASADGEASAADGASSGASSDGVSSDGVSSDGAAGSDAAAQSDRAADATGVAPAEAASAASETPAVAADAGNDGDPDSPGAVVAPPVVESDGGPVLSAASRPGVAESRALIFAQTNEVRKDNGRSALRSSTVLDDIAQRWSEQQARDNAMGHNSSLASQLPGGWNRAGENVAAGQSHDTVVAAWRTSPPHFGNIIGGYSHVGIGVAYSSSGRPFYTQVFARYPNGLAGDLAVPLQPGGPFVDVGKNHKFVSEITWMKKSGLSTGVTTSIGQAYQPSAKVSREAMAAFLYRLSTPDGASAPKGYVVPKTSPFVDVPTTHKFYREIAWMYVSGLSTGTGQRSGKPKYSPSTGVSREAMAAFMFRLEAPAGYRAPGTSPFVDVPTSHKFYKQIAWMRSSGLSTGVKQSSGKAAYLAADKVSREAMAAFLYRSEH